MCPWVDGDWELDHIYVFFDDIVADDLWSVVCGGFVGVVDCCLHWQILF
jgi:hypothetical protein